MEPTSVGFLSSSMGSMHSSLILFFYGFSFSSHSFRSDFREVEKVV